MTVWAAWVAAAVVLLALAGVVGRRRRCAVYEYYDAAGASLYVGIAYDPAARARAHRRRSWWWPQVDPARTRVVWYRSRAAAAEAERARIRRLRPVANIVHNGGRGRRVSARAQSWPVAHRPPGRARIRA